MVMQTPCIRLIATIISLVLYFEFEDHSLMFVFYLFLTKNFKSIKLNLFFFRVLKIIDFVSLPSLLLGIYCCHILVTTVTKLVIIIVKFFLKKYLLSFF